jgi:hypothetical protein
VGSGGQGGGGGAKRRAAPEKRPLGRPYQPGAVVTDLVHMHPASPLVASLGGLNAVFFIPPPFLACDMQQSPGNGVPHLRNGLQSCWQN